MSSVCVSYQFIVINFQKGKTSPNSTLCSLQILTSLSIFVSRGSDCDRYRELNHRRHFPIQCAQFQKALNRGEVTQPRRQPGVTCAASQNWKCSPIIAISQSSFGRINLSHRCLPPLFPQWTPVAICLVSTGVCVWGMARAATSVTALARATTERTALSVSPWMCLSFPAGICSFWRNLKYYFFFAHKMGRLHW